MAGFVDLRLNHRAGASEEGFWPSFTDIMTVIVLIFLLTIVGILLRNFELVRELQAIMAAEREAAAIVRSTVEEKTAIAGRLDESENEVARLRLQLMQVQEANQANLESRRRAETEVSTLQDRNRQLQQQQAGLTEDLAASRTRLSELKTELTTRRQQSDSLKSKLDTTARQLMAAQGEYTELKDKYDKLIKPARSPKGRQLVEVRYRRSAGALLTDLKLPGSTEFERVDQARLHSLLTALKDKHPSGVYVKILIPEDSGLSYKEAWDFTSALLQRYDYYYQ